MVKLVAQGAINAGLWKMIIANVRARKEVAGDLRARISANNLGLRRFAVVLDRYGPDTVRFYMQHILSASAWTSAAPSRTPSCSPKPAERPGPRRSP